MALDKRTREELKSAFWNALERLERGDDSAVRVANDIGTTHLSAVILVQGVAATTELIGAVDYMMESCPGWQSRAGK